MKELELGYIAGIIDGEGCIHFKKCKQNIKHRERIYVEVKVVSTDLDILEMCKNTTGIGNIKPKKSEHKPAWVWFVSRNRDVKALLTAIYPVMSERRKKKIEEALIYLENRSRIGGSYDGTTFVQITK